MTTIVRWAPFNELELMERRMRRLLQDVGVAPAPLPAADLYETDNEVVVELEVPGFVEKDLALEVSDHTLTVKGERKKATEEQDKTFYLHERLEERFERQFKLPPEVDTAHVHAKFHAGVLEVHVPKLEPVQARTIAIGS